MGYSQAETLKHIADAWALVRKGGHSAKIGRRFLMQRAIIKT